MATLTAHLRRTDDHGALSFHPDCPVCRAERLSGTLPGAGPVGRRTTAAVVAAMLASSVGTPTLADAQEPDQVTEGVAPEESSGDRALRPEFDPGGADEGLGVDEALGVDEGREPAEPDPVGPAPAPVPVPVPVATNPEPPETQPVADSDVPVADAGLPAPAATPTPSPAPPALQHLEQSSARPDPALDLVAQVRVKPEPTSGSAGPAPDPEPPVVEPQTALVAQGAHDATTNQEATRSRGTTTQGDRFRVVRPGESLWSIARDVLGRDASPARIARVVNELWERNSAQIATGNPDMLRVGTRLTLP